MCTTLLAVGVAAWRSASAARRVSLSSTRQAAFSLVCCSGVSRAHLAERSPGASKKRHQPVDRLGLGLGLGFGPGLVGQLPAIVRLPRWRCFRLVELGLVRWSRRDLDFNDRRFLDGRRSWVGVVAGLAARVAHPTTAGRAAPPPSVRDVAPRGARRPAGILLRCRRLGNGRPLTRPTVAGVPGLRRVGRARTLAGEQSFIACHRRPWPWRRRLPLA